MFSSRYNAARHESICKYRPEPSRNVSASEICLETATHPSSAATNLECDIELYGDTLHVGGTSSRNSQSKDIEYDVSSEGGRNEEKTEYLFEAAELILNVRRLASRKLAEELLQFLSWSKLVSEDYRTSLPNIKSCEEIISERVKQKCLSIDMVPANISITGSDGAVENHTFFLRNTQDIIRKQLALARNDEVVLRPFVQDSTAIHPLHSKFCENVYKNVRNHVQRSTSRNIFWNEKEGEEKLSFVGMLQVYTDKTATSLKANAVVAYPVHVVLLNFTQTFRRFLIDHGHTFVGLLPVCTTTDEQDERDESLKNPYEVERSVVPLYDALPASMEKNARNTKLQVLHEAMQKMFQPLSESVRPGFMVDVCGKKWKCHPALVSYCCDLPEGKDMSGVKHGATMYPCIRCLTSKHDIRELKVGPTRFAHEMDEVIKMYKHQYSVYAELLQKGKRREARAILDECVSTLDLYSLNGHGGVLSPLELTSSEWCNDRFSVFTVEPLHLLHLGISKKLKECTVGYLSVTDKEVLLAVRNKRRKKASSCKSQLLNGCNNLLSAYQKEFPIPGLQVSFSTAQKSSQLNGFFTSTGVKGMLEGKDYAAVDTVFPFIAAFLDRAIGCADNPALTTVHTLYSDIVNQLLYTKPERKLHGNENVVTSETIRRLKMVAKNLFEDLEDFNLFTLKFHMLDHIAEDVSRFGALNFVDASPFEHFNYVIKKFIRMTSMRRGSTLGEAVKVINSSVATEKSINKTGGRIRKAKLVRDGTIINLVEIATSTMACLAHIDKDGRGVLASQCLEIVQNSFQLTGHRFLLCDVDMNIVKSGFIHGGVAITLDDYDERKGVIKLNNPNLEILQRVYADHCFGPSKAKRFSVTLVEGEENAFWFAQVQLLFHLNTRTNDRMSGEFAFVRYFEITPPIDNVDRVLNCLCLRWATGDECDRTITPDLQADDTMKVGEWYGVIPFSSITSVHHIVRSNYSVYPFTSQLPWPLYRFYVNRFYQHRQ